MHFHQWKRREFITLLGSATAAWPLAARAQQTGRMRRIGVLLFATLDDRAAISPRSRRGSQPLGWSEGRNVRIDTRQAGGEVNNQGLRRGAGTPEPRCNPGARHADLTNHAAGDRHDPDRFHNRHRSRRQRAGCHLARPGGNITGFTNFEFSMGGKWLELLKEAAPTVRNVTVPSIPTMQRCRPIARDRGRGTIAGVAMTEAKVRNRDEIQRALDDLAGVTNTGLLVLPEFLTTVHRDLIVELATRHRVPSVYAHRYFTASGGLISYGVDNNDVYRRAAGYVDRILRGEKPPIYQCSSPPNSSWSSISRPPRRSASTCRRCCSPAPMR